MSLLGLTRAYSDALLRSQESLKKRGDPRHSNLLLADEAVRLQDRIILNQVIDRATTVIRGFDAKRGYEGSKDAIKTFCGASITGESYLIESLGTTERTRELGKQLEGPHGRTQGEPRSMAGAGSAPARVPGPGPAVRRTPSRSSVTSWNQEPRKSVPPVDRGRRSPVKQPRAEPPSLELSSRLASPDGPNSPRTMKSPLSNPTAMPRVVDSPRINSGSARSSRSRTANCAVPQAQRVVRDVAEAAFPLDRWASPDRLGDRTLAGEFGDDPAMGLREVESNSTGCPRQPGRVRNSA